VPVGLVLSAAVVWQSTAAAFTASTDNAGNSWQTGSVVLADSSGGATGTALFDAASNGALKPLANNSRCIRVDYTGSLPADVKLYVTTPSSGATTLDQYLLISIEQGQSTTPATTVAADCSSGFLPTTTPTFVYDDKVASDPTSNQSATLSALKGTAHDYTSGLLVGHGVTGNTSLTFRITYSVKDVDAAQSKQSTATFTWEAQNT
jgi:hypothetical protein